MKHEQFWGILNRFPNYNFRDGRNSVHSILFSNFFYMENKNIDGFLKAEPNVEPPPPGSVPPTEV